ncbi:MAG: NAD-glutamate dehydrogenase [Hyphomicrobiaceae bacterium]|nr:NAD-glutamate dehydrogenase [Hyphomicrobiaceae bacterium]
MSDFDPGLVAALSLERASIASARQAAFDGLARALFERLAEADHVDIPVQTLAGIARRVFEMIVEPPARRQLDISSGWAGAHPGGVRGLSVVAVHGDDKPFLVSSVVGEILARGVRPRLVLHPVLNVVRDAAGQLLDVRGKHATTGGATRAGASPGRDESLIVVVASGLDEATASALPGAIERVLGEVDAVVADWPAMSTRLEAAITALEEQAVAAPAELVGETIAFCRWMSEGQFVLLGMREYRLDGEPETGGLEVVEGSGLGLLRDEGMHVLRRGRELVALTDEVRRFYLKPAPIIITKANVVSRVHRRVHMDYVGLKTYRADGRLAGELRIVGLFTAGAYTERPEEIPFLRLKVEQVFAASGVRRQSHEGRVLQHILDTFPRDELFQIGVRHLASWVPALLKLEFDPRLRFFVRRDRFDRFVSVLAFVPRDRFSTSVRERIGEMLADRFHGRMVAHQPYFTAGPLVRVHYIIGRYEGETPTVPEEELEAAAREIAATWDDKLDELLADVPGGYERFAGAFPAAYSDTFPPERALADIERIDRLGDDVPVAIDFYREDSGDKSQLRFAIYRFDTPIPLSERVPLLENMGFAAIDERTYRVAPRLDGAARVVSIHDMALRTADGRDLDLTAIEQLLEECFVAVFSGRAENDAFNGLVALAGLDWREAAILRAYAGFIRQLGLPFSPRYVAETLATHPMRAKDLVRLFKMRLDPGSPLAASERAEREASARSAFEAALAEVQVLDEDRILRTLLGLICATMRTNFFLCDERGRVPDTIAFKIASREVPEAPEPRPYREIWVTSPEVDGVHLRFAPVARGGLRWSDRAQDFRTEVLGLAKAQQVKNAVIVPQGAKGGFVAKRLPARGSRDEIAKAGVAAYRSFVSTMLDITDNLVDGTPVSPDGVVPRDGDDPYLVVAADKGTASFSDIANAISAEHGFWLDDAFASGGSAGYDHKKMGITARGAWECVKRHFREMDHDIQNEAFRVIGVGDMSGDVFGNGMLLSPAIRLVAAFDHRDIFLDPDPDAAASLAERRRMFALPRSSWQDYDRTLLSKGGGIFSRAAKSIELTSEVRAMLGATKERMAPSELIRAILASEADLLWLGGIGTYVRSDHETDAEVGDRANDPLRISARDLRVKAVGEGANLGLTQRARIDAATRGIRLNTDFIDNSAGVNSSDQEVNIKIALAPALASGRLDRTARNSLLARMTEDVAAACLANNYAQSLAISLEARDGAQGLGAAMQLMHALERRGLLDRGLQALPDDVQLKQRRAAGGSGLTRPEIAVLVSHAKLALSQDLIASTIPENAAVSGVLSTYFPPALREAYGGDIAAHPLRREIVVTELTNRIVNIAGADMPSRLATDWSIGTEGVVSALLTALSVLNAERLFDEIGALDNRVPGALQLALYAQVRAAVRVHAEWVAAHTRQTGTLDEVVKHQSAVRAVLAEKFDEVSTTRRREARSSDEAAWIEQGVTQTMARDLAGLGVLREVGDIALLAVGDDKRDVAGLARTYFEIGDALGLSELRDAAHKLAPADRYDRLAINSAVAMLSSSHRSLSREVAAAGSLANWQAERAEALAQLEARLSDIVGGAPLSIARLTVAAAAVREMT